MNRSIVANVALAIAIILVAAQVALHFSGHFDSIHASQIGIAASLFIIASSVLRWIDLRSAR